MCILYQHDWLPKDTRDWSEAVALKQSPGSGHMQDLLSAQQLPMMIDRHSQDQPLTMYYEVSRFEGRMVKHEPHQ